MNPEDKMKHKMKGKNILIWGPAVDKEKENIVFENFDYIVIFNNYIDLIYKFNLDIIFLKRQIKLIWFTNGCYPRLKGSKEKIINNAKFIYKIIGKGTGREKKSSGVDRVKMYLEEQPQPYLIRKSMKDIIEIKGVRGTDLGINYVCSWLSDKGLKLIKIVGITFYNKENIEDNYEKDYPTHQTLGNGNILDPKRGGRKHNIQKSIKKFKNFMNASYDITDELKKIINF